MDINCRTFAKKLEDYLQDGLDFSGRFAVERHARQCIACSKQLADALRLRQMAKDLQRVKAPANFESALVARIANSRTRPEIPLFGRFWMYGRERSLLRNLLLASAGVVIIAIVASYWYLRSSPHAEAVSNMEVAEFEELNSRTTQKLDFHLKLPQAPGTETENELSSFEPELLRPGMESAETDYVEHVFPGPNNLPLTVRLPRTIHVQLGQASEEYFIRNVSH